MFYLLIFIYTGKTYERDDVLLKFLKNHEQYPSDQELQKKYKEESVSAKRGQPREVNLPGGVSLTRSSPVRGTSGRVIDVVRQQNSSRGRAKVRLRTLDKSGNPFFSLCDFNPLDSCPFRPGPPAYLFRYFPEAPANTTKASGSSDPTDRTSIAKPGVPGNYRRGTRRYPRSERRHVVNRHVQQLRIKQIRNVPVRDPLKKQYCSWDGKWGAFRRHGKGLFFAWLISKEGTFVLFGFSFFSPPTCKTCRYAGTIFLIDLASPISSKDVFP